MAHSEFMTAVKRIREDGLNGDETATERCERLLNGGLRRIIRRVVCRRWQTNQFERDIAAEVERVRLELPALKRESLVNEVASRLCARIAGQSAAYRVDTVNDRFDSTVTTI